MTAAVSPYTYFARSLVTAAIADALASPDPQPGDELDDAIRDTFNFSPSAQTSVLVDTADLAAEAVIRLADARRQSPAETWEWLLATPRTPGPNGGAVNSNDLSEAEALGPTGYIALCLAHIRAGHPIDELATGLVVYVTPTQADVDNARHMAQVMEAP